jgi:hypothetical protein
MPHAILLTAYYYLLFNQASIFEAIPDKAKEIVKNRSLLHEVMTNFTCKSSL